MAYSEKLVERLRVALASQEVLEEKRMFGGVCFMVNDKMCVGVNGDEMMCRIDPDVAEEALEHNHARPMDFTGKPMKGYVFVHEEGLKKKSEFEYWLGLSLEFNKKAKSSKKKK